MPMAKLWQHFVSRYFSDEQAIILSIIILTVTVAILGMGRMLLPLLAAMVIAFLLEGAIDTLMRWGLKRMPALLLVYSSFLGAMVAMLVLLLPLLWNQAISLTGNLPIMLTHSQQTLLRLPSRYPRLISYRDVQSWLAVIQAQIGHIGQWLLALSPNILGHVVTFTIYLVLIPTLVFLLLKDRDRLHRWFSARLPSHHPALSRIASEINQQLYRYTRGRLVEVIIVTSATYIAFYLLGLSYALLLAILVGVSVIIPYIGAIVVTVPVVLVAFIEWGGMTPEFWRILIAHGLIQMIDGNLLVPLLFSEAVDLHPIAIIVAIIIFGGLWGFWGIFFAIPLAVVIRCVFEFWPVSSLKSEV